MQLFPLDPLSPVWPEDEDIHRPAYRLGSRLKADRVDRNPNRIEGVVDGILYRKVTNMDWIVGWFEGDIPVPIEVGDRED